jgi:excisionase family DNA binding protein
VKPPTGALRNCDAASDRLLDVREAAELLGLRPRTVYKLSYEGRLPVVKVGRATRFRLMSLLQLIATWEQPASRPLDPARESRGRVPC